jgi:alkaline phosphatase D
MLSYSNGIIAVFSHLNMTVQNGPEQPLNLDAWDGYMASKNRTLQTLYENNIDNNIVIAGDTHVNWVSDLTWLDHSPYDSSSGAGAIGVEFGGAAVSSPSSFGENTTVSAANDISKRIVTDSESLHWSEGYYRGYFELHITPEQVRAHFFGVPTTKERNAGEISLANFTVKSGDNHLERNSDNVAGDGVVANGFLKNGEVVQTDMVHDTETGRYYTS